MRRLLIALIVLGGIAGLLVATGAIRVRVQVEPAAWVSAAPFWRDEPGTAKLPEALALWVELAKVVKPAVVNVSTTQREQRSGTRGVLPALLRRAAAGRAGASTTAESRLGIHRLGRRLRRHQLSRGARGQRDRRAPGRSQRAQGAAGRQRSQDRHRPAEDRGDEPRHAALRRLRSLAGRRAGHGDRQSIRSRADGDHRHRERQGALHRRGSVRRFHPDRHVDQSRQLRRPAGRCARRPGWDQLGDLLAVRRLGRHRLRHPGEHRQGRAAAVARDRSGDARLSRRGRWCR